MAIIEAADRMNEDAQSALLKTLEEPPAGVTIVLCADQEARLLPTVRSRCFRLRLGLVGSRDIEAILADHGLVDPPTAARLGRLAGGRPGLAMAYARAPEAVLIRAELTRVLLDLTDAGAGPRLAAARAAVPRAIALANALAAAGTNGSAATARPRARSGRRRGAAATAAVPVEPAPPAQTADETADGGRHDGPRCRPRRGDPHARHGTAPGRGGAAGPVDRRGARPRPDRSRWRSAPSTTRSSSTSWPPVAATIDPDAAVAFLERAARSAEWLATNVSPELILDALVLAWPRRATVAA